MTAGLTQATRVRSHLELLQSEDQDAAGPCRQARAVAGGSLAAAEHQ